VVISDQIYRYAEGFEMTILNAMRLTTCSVAADGSGVAIGVADEEGHESTLTLPTECLKALIMTLPDMMRRALRLQYQDPSLRLVYPVASWEIELSTQPGTFILTLRTADKFHVSFALGASDLQEMSEIGSPQDDSRQTTILA
jgi:hypothetical protein